MRRQLFNIGAALLGVAFVAYTVARACVIPVTVDEAATCMNSVPRTFLDVLTYRADPVPNNHILNTLGIQFFTTLFGTNTWSIRLPNLLGGLLYFVAAVGLARRLTSNTWLRLFAFLLLLANLYVVEFFSLARGYGLAVGLLLASVWQAGIFFENKKNTTLGLAVGCAGLSVLANFSLLNFFAPFVGLLLIFIFFDRKNKQNDDETATPRRTSVAASVGIVLGLTLLTAAVCYLPMRAILDTDQLVFWRGTTFWRGLVIGSLAALSHRHTEGEDWVFFLRPLLGLVVGLVVLGWLVWVWRMARDRWKPPTLHSFVSCLLAGALVTHLAQVWLLDAPYLDTRTSMFLYPLAALHVATLVIFFWTKKSRYAAVFMLALALLIGANWYRCANLRCSHEWYFDEHTFRVLDWLRELHTREGRTQPLAVNVNGVMLNSFVFHTKHSDWPDYRASIKPIVWHDRMLPDGSTEFWISTEADEIVALRERGYHIANDLDPHGNFKLWQKAAE
jgi:hypothetical protein